MKKPSRDIMNAVARSVLMLYAYDDKADDTSVPNVVRQSLQLISELPLLAVYSYQAYRHFHVGGSLIIHEPDPKLSTAGNNSAFIKGGRQIYTVRSRDSGYCTGTACRTRRR